MQPLHSQPSPAIQIAKIHCNTTLTIENSFLRLCNTAKQLEADWLYNGALAMGGSLMFMCHYVSVIYTVISQLLEFAPSAIP